MKISQSTSFAPGIYQLSVGLRIVSSNIVVDFGGAELIGTNMSGIGLIAENVSNVTVKNLYANGFYYGAVFRNCKSLVLTHLDLSNNWRDPNAFLPTPPWLEINVTPSYFGDLTNLGGGLWLERVSSSLISNSTFRGQNNGIDAFYLTYSTIINCDASNNVGWGFHLFKSMHNKILQSKADYVTRGPGHYTCDTAGLLMNCQCMYNTVANCSFRFGGDGIFMSGFPRNETDECCPSNFNVFEGNDCSYSPNNAIEATFGHGNSFIDNYIVGANYAFWLGYSAENFVSGNQMINCTTAGIAIDHGQNSRIVGNTFSGNGVSLWLWSDREDHYPSPPYGCIKKPNQTLSQNYTIHDNFFFGNAKPAMILSNTTQTAVINNWFEGTVQDSATDPLPSADVTYNLVTPINATNIAGGRLTAGNYWSSMYNAKLWCSSHRVFGSVPMKLSTMSTADNLPLCGK